MGRKNKYETHVQPYLKQIAEWYSVMTEAQIAKKLGVSVASWENYKNKYPELAESLKNGRESFIVELKDGLKKKALGFHYKETKMTIREVDGQKTKVIEEYERYAQPDTGAIHLLLKNLDPDWRNDDQTTIELKKQKLELDKEKQESSNWG